VELTGGGGVLEDGCPVGAREALGVGDDAREHVRQVEGGADDLTDLAERPQLVH
jgi:hypothetical protein